MSGRAGSQGNCGFIPPVKEKDQLDSFPPVPKMFCQALPQPGGACAGPEGCLRLQPLSKSLFQVCFLEHVAPGTGESSPLIGGLG